jgi:CBS domain-containing protein
MLIRNIMNKKVIVAKPEVTLKEASEVMSKLHIGSLIITQDEKIVGILTGTDVLKSVAQGKNPDATSVEEIMSKDVKTISPDKSIQDAVDLMVKHKIKKLPVVDGKKLLGMITASDIVVVEPKLVASIASLVSLKLPGYSGG